MECSQSKGAKPKMRQHKLKSGVKWHRVLKQESIKLTGKRQGRWVYIFKWTTIFREHKKLPSVQRCNQVAVNLRSLKTHTSVWLHQLYNLLNKYEMKGRGCVIATTDEQLNLLTQQSRLPSALVLFLYTWVMKRLPQKTLWTNLYIYTHVTTKSPL